jgi:hypothetical protein
LLSDVITRTGETMDFTAQNLDTIRSIHLHNMAVDEVVLADSQVESHFHFSQGIWWREVKPFFYQPAAAMTQIVPHAAAPTAWRAVGGYYHMVPPGAPSNGHIVVNEMPDIANYRLDNLNKSVRYEIRRGLSTFRIGQVTDLEELLADGYRVYLDWEGRTANVRIRRSDPAVFRRWITAVFSHPYRLILGAYFEDRLSAYVIAHAVAGVASLSKCFSDAPSRRYAPSSVLIYAYLRICAQSSGIHKACDGLRSTKDSLERYKAKLGFRQVSYPAFICLRPVIRPLVRWLMPMEYRRLMGQYAETLSA